MDSRRFTRNVRRVNTTPLSPTQLPGLTLWLDPTRKLVAGTSWTDVVSGAVCAQSGTGLTAGNGINGRPTVDLNGASTALASNLNLNLLMTVSAWSALVVFRYTGATAESANYYSNPFIVGDASNTFWGLTCSTTKLDVAQFDSSVYVKDQTNITTATNYYAIAKYDGAKIFTALNGSSFDAGIASNNIGGLSFPFQIGRNNGSTAFFQGSLGDILLFNNTISQGSANTLAAWARSRWGI
jgi:hypothetical protein